MNALLHALPKVELHCHLDGSLSLATIRTLAEAAGIALPQKDKDLKKLVTATADAEDLMAYLTTFDFIRPLLQTKKALSLASYDVARQAAEENVRYIEIRFAPELSMDRGLTALETVQAVVDGLKQAEDDFDITARALVCGMRQSPIARTEDIFAAVLSTVGHGVGGYDFAGNEPDFPPETVAPAIAYAQAHGVPLTFHAGESHCPQSIAETIALGITRIGHGTAISEELELIQNVLAHQVTLEMCLSSNLQTKAARTIAEFPYPALYASGARITINTDNRTVSQTTLTREYELYMKYFKTGVADFLQFNQNALDAAFLSEATRNALKERLTREYAPFL